MDLLSFGKDMLQNIAEHAASYRLGQAVLKKLDRALWVVEKCARWAVPPPLDQDERPQPELVRPLPWVFFIMMLMTLRVARETVSLANLVMGKPPLRSADVVIFVQGKRRWLRTLKYQGCRVLRARCGGEHRPWYSGVRSLFALTMCYRRDSQYGNNNAEASSSDEIVVIKRTKHGPEEVPSPTETTMERLIEKMMVNLDAESDEDAHYTIAATAATEASDLPESDLHTPTTKNHQTSQSNEISQTNGDDIHFSPNKNENSSSTPEKDQDGIKENHADEKVTNDATESGKVPIKDSEGENTANEHDDFQSAENSESVNVEDSIKHSEERKKLNENITGTYTGNSASENSVSVNQIAENSQQKSCEDAALSQSQEKDLEPKEDTKNLLKSERTNHLKTPKKDHKIANGRTVKSAPSKKKGVHRERGESNELPPPRVPSNTSF